MQFNVLMHDCNCFHGYQSILLVSSQPYSLPLLVCILSLCMCHLSSHWKTYLFLMPKVSCTTSGFIMVFSDLMWLMYSLQRNLGMGTLQFWYPSSTSRALTLALMLAMAIIYWINPTAVYSTYFLCNQIFTPLFSMLGSYFPHSPTACQYIWE